MFRRLVFFIAPGANGVEVNGLPRPVRSEVAFLGPNLVEPSCCEPWEALKQCRFGSGAEMVVRGGGSEFSHLVSAALKIVFLVVGGRV